MSKPGRKRLRNLRKGGRFLTEGDVSECPRCGEYVEICHVLSRSLRDDWEDYPIIGFVCGKCGWRCGKSGKKIRKIVREEKCQYIVWKEKKK